MKNNKQYKNGFRWGDKAIKKAFMDNGEAGIAACDKAASTCSKYATDMSIKRTAKGKVLTPELRRYYQGIADGMLQGYNSIYNGGDK